MICAEYWMGSNDVVRIMRLALEDLGAQILELNLLRYPDLVDAPESSAYPRIPKKVRLKKLQPFLDAFRPDVVMCVAGGITFREDEYRDIMNRCVTVGITVSDPEAYYYHGVENFYAHRFKYFFTNSCEAQRLYHEEHGLDANLFQHGCYPGFHRPMRIRRQLDLAVVGHGKPDRVEAVNRLAGQFSVGIWGQGWEGCVLQPCPEVHGRDYIRAINSARFYISFPRTVTNRLAMKCHIFEATACRVPVLTEYFDEMRQYFAYDREIIGYSSLDELRAKIVSYLQHYDSAQEIARMGYRRCVSQHTWHQRWRELFRFLSEKEGKPWTLRTTWRLLVRRLVFPYSA